MFFREDFEPELDNHWQEVVTRMRSVPTDERPSRKPDNGHFMTLREIADELSVTRERVRQIEAKALRKLRSPAFAATLKAFTDECYHETAETVSRFRKAEEVSHERNRSRYSYKGS